MEGLDDSWDCKAQVVDLYVSVTLRDKIVVCTNLGL